MESIKFEWDKNKNRVKQDKHGASLKKAKEVCNIE